jgi:hypothetical protein
VRANADIDEAAQLDAGVGAIDPVEAGAKFGAGFHVLRRSCFRRSGTGRIWARIGVGQSLSCGGRRRANKERRQQYTAESSAQSARIPHGLHTTILIGRMRRPGNLQKLPEIENGTAPVHPR